MSVPATEHVDATFAGAAVTLAIAAVGYLGTRKSRPDAAAVLVESAMKLAQVATQDNDELREEIKGLKDEIHKLRAGLEACQSSHAAAQQELAEVRKQVHINTSALED